MGPDEMDFKHFSIQMVSTHMRWHEASEEKDYQSHDHAQVELL